MKSDIYLKGYRAGHDNYFGRKFAENPHTEGTEYHKVWQLGESEGSRDAEWWDYSV